MSLSGALVYCRPAMPPASPAPWRQALAGALAMAVAMGIGRFVFTPILPGMMAGLGLSAADAGLIASANYLGYLLGALLAAGGWAEGRERPLVVAGLAASAGLAAAMALSDALVVFLLVRLAAGVASAFVMVFMSSLVFARLAAAGRGDLQAVHFGGVGAGIAVSALMTGALDLAGAGWPAGWLWAGVLSALGLAAVLALADRAPRTGPRPPREPALPRDPGLRLIVLAYGLFGFGYIVTATFLVAIVREGAGGRLFEPGVWLVTGLAAAPSVWLWAKAARRLGLTATFAVGCAVEAAGVMASVLVPQPAGPLIGGVLLGGTFVAVTALGLQAGRRLAGDAPRRALALMTAAFGTGQILGPIVAGYATDLTGSYLAASLAAAAALVLSAAVAYPAERLRAGGAAGA